MPFLRLASGGRSTVSTEEVQEMKVGSEMSCLLMDCLRHWPERLKLRRVGELRGLVIVGWLPSGNVGFWRREEAECEEAGGVDCVVGLIM